MDIEDTLRKHHIYPVRISTPFAVGEVYAYLIKDEKVVLVDCGHKSADSYRILVEALGNQGVDMGDLDEIWLTHGHPDHFGQAQQLAAESGAILFGHVKERANFAGNKDGRLFDTFFQEHQVPADQITLMTDQLDWLQQFQSPVKPRWVNEKETLTSGRMTFYIKHTPGHAPGHLTFYSDEGLIFGGDVLLEHISTNALINFDPDSHKRNKSLLQYRSSLEWIRELRGIVLPGHGRFIANIREVAEHHLHEHEKRYEKIRLILKEKPRSLFELGQKVFPDAIKKGATFLVLSEVLGYLDWGISEGEFERYEDGFGIRD